MRRGFTNKPCPGCGAEGSRPTNGVCQVCEARLRLAIALEKSEGQRQGLQRFTTKKVSYALPYFLHQTDRLRDAIHALSHAVSQPAADDWNRENAPPLFDDTSERRGFDVVRMFEPRHAAALIEIFEASREAVVGAYTKGHNRGRDLLRSLASGEVTADQFNDAAIRQESRS